LDAFLNEWLGATPDWHETIRITVKLIAALIAGAIVGVQRERSGKPAGLRTHMLVALGTAVFVMTGVEYGMHEDALSRVLQGLTTGIGFIGAGTILKIATQYEIKGLTTAASIWATAAISAAIGLGQFVLAFISAAMTWIVLTMLVRIERRMGVQQPEEEE
jgi:putative Mg2+ transporter-C (MgtC) family protein